MKDRIGFVSFLFGSFIGEASRGEGDRFAKNKSETAKFQGKRSHLKSMDLWAVRRMRLTGLEKHPKKTQYMKT